MGTGYIIPIDNSFENVELEVGEHSNKLDITVRIGESGQIDLGTDLTPEQLANVGFELIKIALYWCGDTDMFRAWLHKRVDEVDHAGAKTMLNGRK